MREYDPEVEEIDLEDVSLYEGKPDFDKGPGGQANEAGHQDDIVEGEALGDDLSKPEELKPSRDELEEQEDPNA